MTVLIAGCGPRSTVSPEQPLLMATAPELIGRLDERTKSIQTLKALVTIHPEGQPAMTASLSFARSANDGPPSVRLKGFDPFGRTLFDLVSAGDKVRLTIPGEGRVLKSGPNKQDDPLLPVHAAELRLAVSALVGPFVGPGEVPVLERAGASYLIHLIRVSGAEGRLTKRLWFERGRLQLVHEEIFENDAGSKAAAVEFFDYRTQSGPAGSRIDWPGRLILTRPGAGSDRGGRLELEFQEVHPNAVIPPDEFKMP
ncbi:MAG: hypothetical protein HY283_08880 [Nitrospirae bacterium]|nr:hypothetical protein [Nitrospirota bacterium]